MLTRYIAQNNEFDNWPELSPRLSGRLNQEATASGFENISPGRNLQFIPYVESRTFRGTSIPAIRRSHDSTRRIFRARRDWIRRLSSTTAWCWMRR